MADADHKAAYEKRQSATTRNPHTASAPGMARIRELAKLEPEDRIVAQWKDACGCPIADDAKSQFGVSVPALTGMCDAKGGIKTFALADVRLWSEHHRNGKAKDGKVYLEFFFDGSPTEFEGNDDVFIRAFEQMIEAQLQERRIIEFRKRLAARRRPGKGSGSSSTSSAEDCSVEGGSDCCGDDDWKSFLRTPVPETELKVRSIREAGCMLRFLVCQTSISVSASEVLGQVSFQEHFPIDGVPQEADKSDKPMPRWVYGMAGCTALSTVLLVFSWWQIARQVLYPTITVAVGS
eukprot:gnl/TRDRNA2_/TRDRNA2_180620_c0_seq1.p1 gnl/TRDRNA2_/TRDRNA2_180620_c0~~gnl/TRDRNA2_/TRDRNA2_180620_c0_seq1.p1  ORF type:complete len:293 (+),score=42.71 gnl/TRDRNA2_/TRDRNA2_180620_c0_seq1:120-998(+)